MSDPFFSMKNVALSYKAQVFLGILSKRAFVGPCVAVITSDYRCNYRCIFCKWFSPMAEKRNKPAGYINLDTYKGLVKELAELGTKFIMIGNNEEPFIDSRLIEKVKIAKHYGLGCFVISNGSLLDKGKAEKLVESKLDYLNVSLNAGTPETYPRIHTTETEETFQRIVSMVSFIEKLKNERGTDFPHTRLSMVVCNRNYQDIPRFVELCHQNYIKSVWIKRFISPSREMAAELELTPRQEEEAKESLAQAQKSAAKYGINLEMERAEWTSPEETEDQTHIPCYYGWLFTVIDPNGNVYPCCFQDSDSSGSFGNVKEAGFKKVWLSKKYRDFRINSKNIDGRKQMGLQCNQAACFFNNKQVYETLHKPYRYLLQQ